jgi:hypothetical protein
MQLGLAVGFPGAELDGNWRANGHRPHRSKDSDDEEPGDPAAGAFVHNLPLERPPPGKELNESMIVPTGIFAEFKGGVLKVTQVTPDTPAAGKLEKGDVWLSVDGESLEIQDPRHPLGFALNAAEGRDGKMKFGVERGGAKQSVVVQLEPLGSCGPTYPVDCAKSKRIVDEVVEAWEAKFGEVRVD